LEQELTEAGVDTRDLAAAQQRLAGTAGQLKAAQEGVAGATTRAGSAQDRFASGGRPATAVTQGLPTQVVGLISAYAGLQAGTVGGGGQGTTAVGAAPPRLKSSPAAAASPTAPQAGLHGGLATRGLRSDRWSRVPARRMAKDADQIPEALTKAAAALRAYQLQ